jgi:uncharacterized protein with HEPN domain
LIARDHRDALADMLTRASLAVELVRGVAPSDLSTDHRTRLAVERALEILGEAAGKVPEAVRANCPALP